MDRSKIWLWGQTAGAHHAEEAYGLPGVNRMSPKEGAEHFGIENLCRVKMGVDTDLSLQEEVKALAELKQIVLSIIGSGGCKFHTNGKDDLDEILEVAKEHPNVMAGIMDDFVKPERLETYTPEVLARMREKLHNTLDRKIELWTVMYERDLEEDPAEITSRLREFDLFTFWTWFGENLDKLEENYKRIRELAGDVRMMMGVYMWDYGNRCPLSDERMKRQIAFVEEKTAKGEIEGIILCSNCVADIGLSTERIAWNWIKQGNVN